jgi:hypothetical protein
MLTFNFKYFFLAVVLFITEVLIALFVHDNFCRPYFGDYLVVMLIYCSIKTFIKASSLKVAVVVLMLSYTIEVLQYFNVVDKLGLSDNKIAKTVIGFGFEWWDLLAYTLGVITILALERLRIKLASMDYPKSA